MKKYVIERAIPGVDKLGGTELKGAAATSNSALARLAPRVQWLESFVAADKTFCIYLAEDEAAIEEHASAGSLEERRRRNLATEVFAVASARAGRHLEAAVADDPELARLLEQVQRRELDPLTAVRTILREVFHLGDPDSPDTH